MCKVCDMRANTLLNSSVSGERLETFAHYGLDAGNGDVRGVDAMWLTGHRLVPPQVGALIVVPDNVGGDTNTTATLTVGAPSIVSTTNTIGDQDFYKITLEAGKTYEFGMYAKDGGPNGVAHGDAYLEIFGADGKLIVSGDGGAATVRNQVNSGFDVLLTFTPEVSGTFFVNARAFDQDPVNGTTGDFVGDYELFAREATGFAYKPYYDVNSPLYALDWGSQVDGSSRNPDGQEGTRPTGNKATGYAWNPYGIEGKTVITYYFAKAGDVFVSENPANPGLETIVAAGFRGWEMEAFRASMRDYEEVADVVYIEVQDRKDADFKFITYDGTPNVGVLGRMSPPDEQNEGQAEFNRNGPGWNEANLKAGGFSYITLIHELGHGHGLAHPHDNGGRSGIMRGVVAEGVAFDYTTGDFDLNQGVFTMMSYEDGWVKSPYGNASTTAGYGYLGGLMAFDIAAIQDKYGVNEDTNTGNNVYVLKDVNASGTFYKAIWDNAGIDTITYSGARAATIDLRPATLKYEVGGGGFISYAFGIFGGFTIANGVVIENASGGSGNDTLIGNAAANELDGGAGADSMTGGRGNDLYVVDNSGDTVIELVGEGNDRVLATASFSLLAGSEVELLTAANQASTNAMDLRGNEFSQALIGNEGANLLEGFGGTDTLYGLGGNDVLDGGAGVDTTFGGAGNDTHAVDSMSDTVFEAVGEGYDRILASSSYALRAGVEVELLSAANQAGTESIHLAGNEFRQVIYGNEATNSLEGNGGNDELWGFGGNDVIDGGAGNDLLFGGDGRDRFIFSTALGSDNVDTIRGFLSGTDHISLNKSVFTALGLGPIAAGAFVVGTAAGDADDRLIYDQATGRLFYDADGNGAGAAIQFAQLEAGTALTVGDFSVI